MYSWAGSPISESNWAKRRIWKAKVKMSQGAAPTSRQKEDLSSNISQNAREIMVAKVSNRHGTFAGSGTHSLHAVRIQVRMHGLYSAWIIKWSERTAVSFKLDLLPRCQRATRLHCEDLKLCISLNERDTNQTRY